MSRSIKGAEDEWREGYDSYGYCCKAMSESQFSAFLEKVKASEELQKKLRAASDPDAAVAIAQDAGYVISASAAKEAAMQADLLDSGIELSERELESVAGGAAPTAASCETTAGCRCWTRD